jgi:hypothetical protein
MTIIAILIILGIINFGNWTWNMQVKIGNWLKHKHPTWKILRIFWWSMCDVDGFCEYEIYDTFIKPQQNLAQKEIRSIGWFKYLRKKLTDKK